MRKDLAEQAVSIDGQFIEDLLPGYMTVKTSGREALTATLETIQVGRADGETLRYSRYPARTITVEFMVSGTSREKIVEKVNHLNNLLTPDERDFIFNDEDDKYFTGIPTISEIETINKNAIKGKFQIYCAYPFKRSNEVYEITGVPGEGSTATFDITYNGTYPSKPVLVAEFAGALENGDYSDDGDCGFVVFVDSDENIIQLGNPDAIDIDGYSKAGQLINRTFSTVEDWTQSGGHSWNSKTVDGSVAVASINDTYWNKGKGQTMKFAKPTYGADKTTWHGPVLWQPLSGETSNFDIAIVHRMCAKGSGELGTFECGGYSADGVMIAGFVIEKTASGTNGTVRYIVNGKSVKTESIDLSYYNTHFGYCKRTEVYKTQKYTETQKVYNKKKKKYVKTKVTKTRKVVSGYTYTQSNLNSSIKKSGATVTIKVGNLSASTFTNADIELVSISECSFHFGGYKGNSNLNTNAVASVRLTANPSGTFAEIPNVFTAGDIVEADTYDASVYLLREGTTEGQLVPQYGALGNNWEDFELKQGDNAIAAAWSSWLTNSEYYPTLKIRYNEVFI